MEGGCRPWCLLAQAPAWHRGSGALPSSTGEGSVPTRDSESLPGYTPGPGIHRGQRGSSEYSIRGRGGF